MESKYYYIIGAVVVVLVVVAVLWWYYSKPSYEYKANYDYPGNSYGTPYTIADNETVDKCKDTCSNDSQCVGFNVDQKKYCNFKNKLGTGAASTTVDFYTKK